jgi:hypothetical protein
MFLVVLSGACKGIPEKDFIEEYEPLFCEGYALCASDEMLRTVGERECLQYLSTQEYPNPPDCRYDRKAAEACIEGLKSSGCAGVDPEIPQICADVYSGCKVPRIVPVESTVTAN